MKIKTQRYYFSKSSETLDNWTGGGYYNLLLTVEIWRFKVCFWKLAQSSKREE